MNRTKIINAVLRQNQTIQPQTLLELLRHMNDNDLVCLAIEIGLDTDSILTQEVA